MRKWFVLRAFSAVACAMLASAAHAAVVYVNQGSTARRPNGRQWSSAYRTVQEGIDRASPGDSVWVARGTYLQNATPGTPLRLKDGVALYGGFAGAERRLSQRDVAANPTILDGQGAGTVVELAGAMAAANRFDGFTVRGGSENGLRVSASRLTIASSTFTDNAGYTAGGGVACTAASDVTIVGNLFQRNSAFIGGGLWIDGSTAVVLDNSFLANRAYQGHGGGLAVDNGSSATVTGNLISGNVAAMGAGMRVADATCVITRNDITNNGSNSDRLAGDYGGGIEVMGGGAVSIVGNRILGNATAYAGGGVDLEGATGDNRVVGNLIAGNWSALSGGGLSLLGTNVVTVANNTIAGNVTGQWGGAVYYDAGTLSFVNNVVAGNSTGLWNRGWGQIASWSNNLFFSNNGVDVDRYTPPPGDLFTDPLFVDPAAGDYHLTAASPCVNAGAQGVPRPGEVDMDGQAFGADGQVDIGGDER